ncbi:hypothetical protein [Hymenobacter cellulosilyticus]|uniref:Uncharacterized protein n=1 Tax=Hymenobacter cellulosilyticus TaxID=2932248 RepID=A0A8T9Q2Y3_9BACT|nr:hypothetical protein [Hymenobacter cellulosilyticus]UOQ70218.1 hypothetical protein MUN79_15800 [Hymenobacter cellulosilyticus]
MLTSSSTLKTSVLIALATLFTLSAKAQQEVSVDQFTGTASVSIPLTAATIQGVTVPIGLTYTATGLQADDQGGIVGVGWSLSGVPHLSREVRGLRLGRSWQQKRHAVVNDDFEHGDHTWDALFNQITTPFW